ncbi:MAG: hypothetical protein AB2556_23750, partial [Candidatus Thiodiazotropha sp.]
MAKHQILYDTSEYPKDHTLHSTENKKMMGKMKDECAGRAIAEYVLHPRGVWWQHKKGQGRKKECC